MSVSVGADPMDHFGACPTFHSSNSPTILGRCRHLCSHKCFFKIHLPFRELAQLRSALFSLYNSQDDVDEIINNWTCVLQSSHWGSSVVFVSPKGFMFKNRNETIKYISFHGTGAPSVVESIIANDPSWESSPERGKRNMLIQNTISFTNLTPLSSPLGLIEEITAELSIWHLLISCILLNRTTRVQIDTVYNQFINLYPTPHHVINDPNSISTIAATISKLGFYNRRAESIVKFASDFVTLTESSATAETDLSREQIKSLTNIGDYAADVYEVFIQGNFNVVSNDFWIREYVMWKLEKNI